MVSSRSAVRWVLFCLCRPAGASEGCFIRLRGIGERLAGSTTIRRKQCHNATEQLAHKIASEEKADVEANIHY